MPENFSIILLAAGASSRMGQSKQLMEVDGEPLLLNTLNAAKASLIKNIVVVLGAYEKEHRALLGDSPVHIVHNAVWKNGMGSSLKCGLTYLLKANYRLQGVVLLVCDQPLLQHTHIDKLVELHQVTKKPIIAAWYANTTGVPAFFEKKYFQQLLNLDDAHGAKKVIQDHPHDLVTMNFPEGEIDLDTPDEYEAFRKRKTTS